MRATHIVRIVLVALSVATAAVMTSAMVRAQDGTEAPPADPAVSEAPAETTAPTGDAAATGQALYADNCTRCHGDDGAADTRMGQRFETAPFTAELFTQLGPDGIRAAIVEGREDMRAVTDLTPEQLDALVAYTLSLVP